RVRSGLEAPAIIVQNFRPPTRMTGPAAPYTGDPVVIPSFKALLIEQDDERKVVSSLKTLSADQLDAGEVLIRVHYSSINYKDALAATGTGKIIRRFPCVGGIDLSGE